MAETHDGFITVLAGEALGLYRRVKFDGSNADTVVYADASDGDSWIGVTIPGPNGAAYASGDQVTIQLRGENRTLKVECSAAVTANASIYPENDGKVSDDAGTVVIGTAFGGTGAGSGSIVEMICNAGSGSAPDEEAIANADGTTGAGIGILLMKTGVTASGDTAIPKPSRKLKLALAWAVIRNATTTTDVKIVMNSTDLSAAVVHDTTDENQLFHLNDALTVCAAASTLYVNLATTCTAPGIDVYVLCEPIS